METIGSKMALINLSRREMVCLIGFVLFDPSKYIFFAKVFQVLKTIIFDIIISKKALTLNDL